MLPRWEVVAGAMGMTPKSSPTCSTAPSDAVVPDMGSPGTMPQTVCAPRDPQTPSLLPPDQEAFPFPLARDGSGRRAAALFH